MAIILFAISAAFCQLFMSLNYLTYIQANQYIIPEKGKYVKTVYLHAGIIFLSAVVSLIFFAALGEKFFFLVGLTALCGKLTYFIIEYFSKRNKFVFTGRGKRLLILTMIPPALNFACIAFGSILTAYAVIYFLLIVYPIFVALINNIAAKYEKKRNFRFIDSAKKALDERNIIKIGITGSYGKTSCKNILATILSEKYKVFATPENYNTPMGIAKAVQQMPHDTEIFIAEMGARHPGDIQELCEIVKPRYGILTGLAEQHLETFLTFGNIRMEKKVLLDLLPTDGAGVLNGNDPTLFCMKGTFQAKTLSAGFDEIKNEVFCKEIKTNDKLGSEFSLHVYGEKIACETTLLGKHNIENILLCVAMATELSLTLSEISRGIARLKPIKHRMEILSRGSIRIIDDSYNCNLAGAKAAFDFLSGLEGRKIVFTQGIVEGGSKAEKINVFLGEMAANAADMVLLCGQNAEWIKRGLINNGFSGEIRQFKKFADVVKIFPTLLRSGDILYMQNDIPDNF